MERGFKGISFPFRIGVGGGVVMSSTNSREVPHIEESIIQILRTRFGERVNEYELGSDLDTQIFEPNEKITHNLIAYQVMDALTQHEPRIYLDEDDVQITEQNERVIAVVSYEVIEYMARHTTFVDLGGVREFE